MSDHNGDKSVPGDSAYKVGYKRPPVASRFQHGNRAAANRRRKREAPQDILSRLMVELVLVKQGGKLSKKPRYEALILNLVQRSLGGDMRAMSLLMKQWDRFNFRPPNYEPDTRDPGAEFRARVERLAARIEEEKGNPPDPDRT